LRDLCTVRPNTFQSSTGCLLAHDLPLNLHPAAIKLASRRRQVAGITLATFFHAATAGAWISYGHLGRRVIRPWLGSQSQASLTPWPSGHPPRDHLGDRLLLGPMWDELAVVAAASRLTDSW